MKKILAMAITVMVIWTAPLAQAQNGYDLPGMEELVEEYYAGKITSEEYQKRAMQILQANQGTQTQQLQQQQREDNERAQAARNQQQQEAAKKREWEQLQRQAQQQEEERKMYPGDTRGWPSAAWFRNLFDAKLASLKLPAGTKASYNKEEPVIYLTGANANTLQELKKQIESALGSKMTGSGNSFEGLYNEVRGTISSRSYVRIELEGNQIAITRRDSAG